MVYSTYENREIVRRETASEEFLSNMEAEIYRSSTQRSLNVIRNEMPRSPFQYSKQDAEAIYSYFQKDSINGKEGFDDYNYDYTKATKKSKAKKSKAVDLNKTYVIKTTFEEIQAYKAKQHYEMCKDYNKDLMTALITNSNLPKRVNKKTGGRLKNLVNMFENKHSSDGDSDELDSTVASWRFVNVPEAKPEKMIIIPIHQQEPYTRPYSCKTSVQPGNVAPMIEQFNRLNMATATTENKENEDPKYKTIINKTDIQSRYDSSSSSIVSFVREASGTSLMLPMLPDIPHSEGRPSLRKTCILRIRSIIRRLTKRNEN